MEVVLCQILRKIGSFVFEKTWGAIGVVMAIGLQELLLGYFFGAVWMACQ
jgi:hypothetical protein